MRFTISSTALSNRLLSLSRVINTKNSLPILNCFMFDAQNGQLTITASDSENIVRMSLNLDSLEGRREVRSKQSQYPWCCKGTARAAFNDRCKYGRTHHLHQLSEMVLTTSPSWKQTNSLSHSRFQQTLQPSRWAQTCWLITLLARSSLPHKTNCTL